MKNLLFPIVLTAFLFKSCNNNAGSKQANTTNDSIGIPEESHMEPVPFALGQSYFVKNTVPEDKNGAFKLESQKAFDEFFSPAASIGDTEKHNMNDFDKEFVIAIISANSDLKPCIYSISLIKEGAELLMTYKESFGEKQSFTMRPH